MQSLHGLDRAGLTWVVVIATFTEVHGHRVSRCARCDEALRWVRAVRSLLASVLDRLGDHSSCAPHGRGLLSLLSGHPGTPRVREGTPWI